MRRLVRVVGAAFVLAAVLASGASAKEWKTLKIETEGAFAPWNFVTAGQLDGFDVELAKTLCQKMQVTCEITAQDWDGMIPALNAGKYDAIMAAMISTPKRRDVIDFSRSYANGPHGFAVLKTSPLAKLPEAGKIFSLTKDDAASQKVIAEMREMLKGKNSRRAGLDHQPRLPQPVLQRRRDDPRI